MPSQAHFAQSLWHACCSVWPFISASTSWRAAWRPMMPPSAFANVDVKSEEKAGLAKSEQHELA